MNKVFFFPFLSFFFFSMLIGCIRIGNFVGLEIEARNEKE